MSKRTAFLTRVLAGDVLRPAKEIEAEVEAWHSSAEDDTSLAEWLGMTPAEYEIWVRDPHTLAWILNARRTGLDLGDLLARARSGMPIAARGGDGDDETARLYEWLRAERLIPS